MKLLGWLLIAVLSSISRKVSEADLCDASAAQIAQDREMLAAAKRLAAKAASGPKHIIVTMSDWIYRPMLLNWMAHMNNLDVLEYLVLCLDKMTYDLVGPWFEGGNGILVPECHERVEIFRFRHILVQTLLKDNFIVILVDSDCVWLKNALPWILSLAGSADIVAQMGFAPNSTFMRRGVTACAGFLTVLPTTRTLHFYQLYVSGLAPKVDDQWHLNFMLEKYNAFQFESNDTSYFHEQPNVVISRPPTDDQRVFHIKLGLLPYYKFPRMNDLQVYKHDDPVVWHNTKNWSVPRREGQKKNRARDKQWEVNGLLVNITWMNVSNSKVVARKAAMKKSGVFAITNAPWHSLKTYSELRTFFSCLDMNALQKHREDKIYLSGVRTFGHRVTEQVNVDSEFSVWKC